MSENIFYRPCDSDSRPNHIFIAQDRQILLQASPFRANVFQKLIFAGLFCHIVSFL